MTAEGVELPEGNIADVHDSYKYRGMPQANGNYKEAARADGDFLLLKAWIAPFRDGKPVLRHQSGSTLGG